MTSTLPLLTEVTPVVELRQVTRRYPATPPVDALRDVNLVIRAGEYVSIVGPSGSGKSTLLHILGCLDRPTGGQYLLNGVDVSTLGDRARTAIRSQQIGFVFQAFHLLAHRSAVENVALAELYQRRSRLGRRFRAEDALSRVGLGHRLRALPSTLSGGESQRVAIARAIVSHPTLLLADEPTGNLDSATTRSILDLFDDLRAQGLTLVVITHEEAVARRAERTVRIEDGLVREDAVHLSGG